MKTPSVREKLTLRIPTDLHRRLTRAAVANGRSLNAEIVQRLRRSLDGALDLGGEAIDMQFDAYTQDTERRIRAAREEQ
jgi:hypothetical protein